MARRWRPQPLGGALSKLAGSGRGPAPTPLAFRSAPDGSVAYRRMDGTAGRASYWARKGPATVWGVDVETRSFVALELHVTKAGEDWSSVHRSDWDRAQGVAFEVVEFADPGK